jgi:RNA polymerase sigma-70 factor (ECF subfamily)
MTATMSPSDGTSLETRPSLLLRLQSGDDAESWKDFYRTYGGLIRFFAEKAGLTPDEAEEVVQETAVGVAKNLPEFTYNPKVCRFKTWLLNLTRWRIQDQLRKRKSWRNFVEPSAIFHPNPTLARESGSTATVERIPDPAIPEFGTEWDAAWEKNVLSRALELTKKRINERQYQIFDLYVMKGWSPEEVAQTLGISVARVYLTKHRISALLKKDVRRLEQGIH